MRIILLLTGLFAFIGSFGQGYIPMPIENGMNWRVHTATGTMDFDNDETIVGDSIIGGQLYKKVRIYTTIFHSGSISYKWIRNDSIGRKIYLRYNNHDTLLYDFNLNLGDTLHYFHLAHLKSAGVDTVTVGFIDSIILNGVYHKRYTSKLIESSPSYYYTVVEGVGSEQGFLTNFTTFEHGTWLICQGKFGLLSIYPDSSYACDTPLNVSIPLSNDDISANQYVCIYPNPAQSKIQIHTAFNLLNGKIIDVYGHTMASLSNFSNQQSIDIAYWPKGIYYIQLHFNNEQIQNMKFLKN